MQISLFFTALQGEKLTTTSHVVLGLVEQLQPATPYELKIAAAETVTNFWSLPHSQLYSECTRLGEAGYLIEERESSGRRRRIFRLTEKGAEALEDWRGKPTAEIYELRDAGLLKLFFGAEPSTLAEAQIEPHRRKLEDYEAQLAECLQHEAPRSVLLAIEAGIGHEREYIRFWSALIEPD